jgi:hypothetical protein
MKNYKITCAPAFLYGIGVNYHATYNIKGDDGAALYDGYAVDKITAHQANEIRDWCKFAKIKLTRMRCAPEITSVSIMFPKAAQMRVHV